MHQIDLTTMEATNTIVAVKHSFISVQRDVMTVVNVMDRYTFNYHLRKLARLRYVILKLRKYNTKKFGGGLVFTGFCESELRKHLTKLQNI